MRIGHNPQWSYDTVVKVINKKPSTSISTRLTATKLDKEWLMMIGHHTRMIL